ncbi:MAG: hypothetical protein COU29_00255 [Candidatus Magasanikbacteria bacterium CG10_big_fil_rev_8_21_14_0_10_36_32]|uniref:Uncharacterized protein n=1 Tax=Candidatus Magasanikbacteria bacterium CG10_big_fil_rev_8_21_14_0_10_36_32 TaxID=1974646 RepID=A0A2M6W7Q0_9BACT|nr:MAG: hypothetical protein COU29_00255 [Candidatus Magasanikbacteria bacterium CG10_big_fil_rev_8_21_14_0_10_36_32]
MSLRQYLMTMAAATALSWSVWILTIFYFDPNTVGAIGLFIFYISLFLSILGTVSTIGFLIRMKLTQNDELVFRHIKKTFKQGFILSVFVITTLMLLQHNLLTWWNFVLLSALYLFIEGIIFTNRKHQNHNYV